MDVLILLTKILFWIGLALFVHGFFIFPNIVFLLGKVLKRKNLYIDTYEPTISLFIPAYNEEKVIAKKIENALSLDYPMEKLEILVCSDCSDDGTSEIVNSYVEKHSNITFNDYRERSGKTGMINKAIPGATGEIIVMTDANTMYDHNALRQIVSGYSSEKIAAVVGDVQFYMPKDSNGLEHEITYHKFEANLKHIEGLFGCVMGAFGGFYSYRKENFTPLPYNAYSNDDFLMITRMVNDGKYVIFNRDAISREETGSSIDEEFKRRVRIGAGNYQSFSFLLKMLNPFHFQRFFFYFSHKLIRWFLPFILLAIYLPTISLCGTSPVYEYAFYIQSALYLVALLGWIIDKMGMKVPFISTVYHFVAMNVGLFMGLFRYLKGIKSAAWTSTERSDEDEATTDES